MRDWVQRSARLSAACQLVFGLVSLVGFARARPYEPLFVMLLLDTAVQAVEFVFYIVLIWVGRLSTYYRYVDWFVTTPTMLVSLMMYVEFLADRTVTVAGFASRRAGPVVAVIVLDVLMLCFGLLGELGWMPRKVAVAWGFAPFVALYAVLYVTLPYSGGGVALVTFQFVVWSGYGGAALLKYDAKNISYNLLDVVAKNIYGVIVTLTAFGLEHG